MIVRDAARAEHPAERAAIGERARDHVSRSFSLAAMQAATLRVYDSLLPGARLSECLERLLAGPCGRSDWLLAYWTRARLFTAEARRTWVEPDVQPLPF